MTCCVSVDVACAPVAAPVESDGPKSAPALKTPEFLLEHGLDPADYGGGRSDDPTPIWITGPDPEEVLSRDTSRMNAEEYSQHLKDIAFMKAYGSYREPDRRKPLYVIERPGSR